MLCAAPEGHTLYDVPKPYCEVSPNYQFCYLEGKNHDLTSDFTMNDPGAPQRSSHRASPSISIHLLDLVREGANQCCPTYMNLYVRENVTLISRSSRYRIVHTSLPPGDTHGDCCDGGHSHPRIDCPRRLASAEDYLLVLPTPLIWVRKPRVLEVVAWSARLDENSRSIFCSLIVYTDSRPWGSLKTSNPMGKSVDLSA